MPLRHPNAGTEVPVDRMAKVAALECAHSLGRGGTFVFEDP